MTTTTKRSFKSKKGVVIHEGEKVRVTFDVKNAAGEIMPDYIRLTTADGRRVATSRLEAAGFKLPSQRSLEKMSSDSVARSVFGNQVEPDGWDAEGSPSWLLVFGI